MFVQIKTYTKVSKLTLYHLTTGRRLDPSQQQVSRGPVLLTPGHVGGVLLRRTSGPGDRKAARGLH